MRVSAVAVRILPVLCIVTAAHGAAARATVTTREEVKVAAHAAIDVESDGGSIKVEPGPAGVVRVEAERRAESEDAARKLPVEVRLDGNTVRVRFHRLVREDHESVAFRVWAPADTKVRAQSGGGAIGIAGMLGGVEARTGGGAVAVSETRGPLRVSSGGGSIDVDHVSGSVDVQTGGGSVSVAGALSGKNRVTTGGGSIHVAIPGDSKLDVDASTGGGGAHNDFGLPGDGNRWINRGFSGKIGDGSGGSLELRTGGGSIELVRD